MIVRYKIYNPAGNITALVIGDEYSLEQRKLINSKIMEKEIDVEQVGFLSQERMKLTMAGRRILWKCNKMCNSILFRRTKKHRIRNK